jgi:hypothetical protein
MKVDREDGMDVNILIQTAMEPLVIWYLATVMETMVVHSLVEVVLMELMEVMLQDGLVLLDCRTDCLTDCLVRMVFLGGETMVTKTWWVPAAELCEALKPTA